MKDATTADNEPKSQIPGDARPAPRLINEPMDQHESTFITGVSLGGIVAGAVVGGAVGLVAAVFPVITWWMGMMIGAVAGLMIVGFVSARLGLRSLSDESLPPDVRRHGEHGLRGS